MKNVPLTAVSGWTNGSPSLPRALDYVCPRCGRLSTLAYTQIAFEHQTKLSIGHVRCVRCTGISTLVVVEPNSGVEKPEARELCIYPSTSLHRTSILGNVAVDPKLNRAYLDAIDTFNAGIWGASVTSCRRTMEGLVKLSLPEGQRTGSLGQQLKRLPEHLNLSKTILELADVLRDGGNIAAHFDLEKEPDHDFAALALDLLDYFLEYVYVIPSQSEALKSKIEDF